MLVNLYITTHLGYVYAKCLAGLCIDLAVVGSMSADISLSEMYARQYVGF